VSTSRPFRFGTGAHATATAAEYAEAARRIEDLGYDTLVVPDHFERAWFAAGPALVAAASATTTLRVGSLVYSNNFRHPALLAREAATVDVLSEGGWSSVLVPATHYPSTAKQESNSRRRATASTSSRCASPAIVADSAVKPRSYHEQTRTSSTRIRCERASRGHSRAMRA